MAKKPKVPYGVDPLTGETVLPSDASDLPRHRHIPERTPKDPPEIWLAPNCVHCTHPDGRETCFDNPWGKGCSECGAKPTRYVRAADHEKLKWKYAKVVKQLAACLRVLGSSRKRKRGAKHAD